MELQKVDELLSFANSEARERREAVRGVVEHNQNLEKRAEANNKNGCGILATAGCLWMVLFFVGALVVELVWGVGYAPFVVVVVSLIVGGGVLLRNVAPILTAEFGKKKYPPTR